MVGIIDVQHVCSDGWHKFTSPQVPGLYLVAEQADLEEAYAEIPRLIEAVIGADFQAEVSVQAVDSYADYEKDLPHTYRPGFRHFQVTKKAA